jgi:hypothetical protein
MVLRNNLYTTLILLLMIYGLWRIYVLARDKSLMYVVGNLRRYKSIDAEGAPDFRERIKNPKMTLSTEPRYP